MQLLAPDILAEGRGLSVAVSAAGMAIGILLWLFGWWAHRFWIVLSATVAAGTLGLYSAPSYGVQPLVAGLLAAVAAGVLALALVRVIAFAAGGLAACMLVRMAAPAWDGPLVSLLVGGLAGLFFFRFWIMTLTSLLGMLLLSYSGLCLADKIGILNAVDWTERHPVLASWACLAVAVLGLLLQFLLERRRLSRQAKKTEKRLLKEEFKMQPQPPKKASWWDKVHRQAG